MESSLPLFVSMPESSSPVHPLRSKLALAPCSQARPTVACFPSGAQQRPCIPHWVRFSSACSLAYVLWPRVPPCGFSSHWMGCGVLISCPRCGGKQIWTQSGSLRRPERHLPLSLVQRGQVCSHLLALLGKQLSSAWERFSGEPVCATQSTARMWLCSGGLG